MHTIIQVIFAVYDRIEVVKTRLQSHERTERVAQAFGQQQLACVVTGTIRSDSNQLVNTVSCVVICFESFSYSSTTTTTATTTYWLIWFDRLSCSFVAFNPKTNQSRLTTVLAGANWFANDCTELSNAFNSSIHRCRNASFGCHSGVMLSWSSSTYLTSCGIAMLSVSLWVVVILCLNHYTLPFTRVAIASSLVCCFSQLFGFLVDGRVTRVHAQQRIVCVRYYHALLWFVNNRFALLFSNSLDLIVITLYWLWHHR